MLSADRLKNLSNRKEEMEFNLKSKVNECDKLKNVVDGLDKTFGKQMNERSLTDSRKK